MEIPRLGSEIAQPDRQVFQTVHQDVDHIRLALQATVRDHGHGRARHLR